MKLWERGIRSPPHHVNVTAVRYEDGLVRAELVGFPVEPEKKEDKKSKAKDAAKKVDKPEKGEPPKSGKAQAEVKPGKPAELKTEPDQPKPRHTVRTEADRKDTNTKKEPSTSDKQEAKSAGKPEQAAGKEQKKEKASDSKKE
jgi:hypothetical protein